MMRTGQAGREARRLTTFTVCAALAGCLLATPAGAGDGMPTVLLAGTATARDGLREPAYNVVVALKTRLQRAGFEVVMDPAARFDAVLVLDYREGRGRPYPNLEDGTEIRCRLALLDPRNAGPPLRTYDFRTETSWPAPLGSLYWDAIQHLEEDAYYYFLGELLHGWWTRRADTVDVFSRALTEPPVRVTADGADDIMTDRMSANHAARRHAIEELGRSRDPRALAALWRLARDPASHERVDAVRAIAAIGAVETLDELRQVAEVDPDARVRAIAADAVARLRN